ncbi:MAG: ABC transporter substrate-binding protein [Acetobacteraceae bacterium]|nr:ABC transporter substrate-binding protein [Acetobacteraceae bacterium]
MWEELGVTMLLSQKLTRRKLASFCLAGCFALLSPAAGRAAQGAPTDVVRNFYGVLLDIMQHSAALGPKGRYQKLEPVVLNTFDVPYMARLSVGPSWRTLSAEQKRRAVQAYSRYIAAIYASRFDAYAGEQLQVLGQQQIKHGTLIKTQIIKSNGEPVAINYVVHDNDIAWQIRDIYLSGAISELATHRSEFANILRTSGIDGLIDSLNKKADDLQT